MATLPVSKEGWMEVLEFKDPQPNDRTGLLALKSRRGFQLVAPGEEPLLGRKAQAPLECLSTDAFLEKGRGQLSMAIKITPALWQSFHALDLLFDDFMVKHASKLFSASDAKYIKDDPKSISLKHPKPLARFNVDGTPNTDGFLNVRIYGRAADVDSFVVKEGRDGAYVASINYKDRTASSEPLTAMATRFAMCTGTLPDGKRTVVETTRLTKPVAPGQPRMRYISPGDFNGGNLLSAIVVPQHWAIVNGSASMCIKLQQCVFENVDAAMEMPDGFVLSAAPEDEEAAPSPAKRAREEPASFADPVVKGKFKAASEAFSFASELKALESFAAGDDRD